MKLLSTLFLVLAALTGGAWIAGYIWISGLACAYSGTGACRIRAPWTLAGEDLVIMVLVPGMMCAVLTLLGLVLRPRR